MKIKVNCKLKYYDMIFDCDIMDGIYSSTNNKTVIRAIFIEDKILAFKFNMRYFFYSFNYLVENSCLYSNFKLNVNH